MGVRVDPQRGFAELSGSHLPLAGGQTPDPLPRSNTALVPDGFQSFRTFRNQAFRTLGISNPYRNSLILIPTPTPYLQY